MPFFLDGNPTQGEVSEAVNYLLSNFTQNVSADPATGQITGPTGEGVGYLYKYIDVKYSDSFDGTSNFSNSPTNRAYYGLRNDDSSAESTNPADYSWYKVTGGFGTTKLLYYLTTGGRQIQFAVATSVPNSGWIQDSGAAIDLDITTKTNAVANFVVIRVANNSAAPTDSECISAIGRTPISGDICTVNYNSGIASITYKYTTGWAVFQKYITGDLIVANSIVASNIAANTITAGQIAANTITAGQIASNTITATQIASATITAGQIASSTITATQIAANTITAGNINVGQLSAISANLGTVTAGSLNAVTITGSDLTIGSTPAISGITMSGSGTKVYTDGRFALGNSSSNIIFNGTNAYINGFTSSAASASSGSSTEFWTASSQTYSQTGTAITLNNLDYTKQVYIVATCAFFLGMSTSGNPFPPEYIQFVFRVQSRYSTNGGSTYSSWQTESIDGVSFAFCDHLTDSYGYDRHAQSTVTVSASADPATNANTMQFRIVREYTAWANTQLTTIGYFGIANPSTPGLTAVNTTFNSTDMFVFQVRV